MKLNNQGLANKQEWLDAGYRLPKFDREAMIAKTKANPVWIHFGAGNIFRAFQANVAQELLNKGILDTGIIVAEGFDYEIVEKMNRPHNEYTIL
ncbi:fructuronate reductase, partial [gut metagenome]